MRNNTMYNEILATINNMSDNDKIALYNAYCEEVGYYDDTIYSMDDFDELMYNVKPWEACRMAFYGDFNPSHNYFTFNGYGNLLSSDYIDELMRFNSEEVADYICTNNEALYNDDIQEILDEYEEEEEEEAV